MDELLFAAGGGGCCPIDFRIASGSGIPDAGVAPGLAGFLTSFWFEFTGVGVFDTGLVFAGASETRFAGAGVVNTTGAAFAGLFALLLAGLLVAGAEPPQPMAIKPPPVITKIKIFLNILLGLTGFKYNCAGLGVASPEVSDGLSNRHGQVLNDFGSRRNVTAAKPDYRPTVLFVNHFCSGTEN